MADRSFQKPFEGAISRYFEKEAPDAVRRAIRDASGREILSTDYPYDKELRGGDYAPQMHALQIELMRMQSWVVGSGARVVIVFEGRDAAGKGGTVKRLAANLNPRVARVVALGKPSDVERGEWYFQRYIRQLPTAGAITIFDRSWYNRGVVEPVMGFCSDADRRLFYRQVPDFESMLAADGIHLIKIWLNVGRAEQLRRFLAREADPLKHWKLSRVDIDGLALWDTYTDAIRETFWRSHSAASPWTVIRADDKRRARLAALRVILRRLPAAGARADPPDAAICGTPDEMGLGSPP